MMSIVTVKNYRSILSSLKDKIRQARLRVVLTANSQLIATYWEIGNTILIQQKKQGWGAKVIDRLAHDLHTAFPDMQGLSIRNISYMRAFAEAYPNFLIVQQPAAQLKNNLKTNILAQNVIVQQPAAQLPWAHHQLILDKLKTNEERFFYISKAVENGWSRNILKIQIENKLYKRQGNSINNFKNTLPASQSDLVNETFKNPYLFDFLAMSEKIHETDLEKALVTNVKKLMLEMGKGFAFVGNQYNITVGNKDRALDLLFYNFHLYRFVVVEIKIGEFEPEYAGKLNFYVNAIDAQVKGKQDNPTIGLLLCRTPDHTTIKYSLHGIKTPIGVSDYKLTEKLPKELKGEFPTIKQIENELTKEIKLIAAPKKTPAKKVVLKKKAKK